MAIQQMVISCGFMFLQGIVNSFDEAMTASYTVACRLECYMLVPISSLSSAMSTYAGQNYGAKEYKRIMQGAKHAVIMSMIMAAVIGSICYLLTDFLIGLFGIAGQSVEFCTAHVHLVCFDLLLYAVYQPFVGLFQGVGQGKVSMCLYIIELGSRIVFANMLAGILAEACVWWNEPIAYILAGIIAYLYFFLGKWKRKVPTMPTKQTFAAE